MYVRDELGGFPKCAYSLLLSVSLFSPIGGGDQQVLVTAFSSFYTLTWCYENLYLCVDALKAKEYHHNLTLTPYPNEPTYHFPTPCI